MPAFRCLYVVLLALVLGLAFSGAAEPAARRAGKVAAAGQAVPKGAPKSDAPEMRIAAVVNDDAISVYDLAMRIRMVLVSSNLPDTPEAHQRVASQVLRSLIDEKLQLQEARRQNVTASDEEVNKALAQIEKQNNMRLGQLDEFIKARGLDRNALVNQVTASIVWAKLVRRQAAQSTTISDEEIDETLKRFKEHSSEPQSRVGEIFLAVDNPAQDEEVRRLAERLTAQMKQGARFSAVAQQFSQSATAAVGGDIGWVRPDQLAPELAKAVSQLRQGELSAPIRTGGGYYLLLVIDRRTGNTGGSEEEVLDIVQVAFPVPPQASPAVRKAVLAELEAVRAAAKDCPTMLKIGKEKAPQLSSEGHLRLAEISPEMRKTIEAMPIGQASQPIMQKNGVGVIMVCGKSTGRAGGVSREDVADSLVRQRLDVLSRRYLRDLRRDANIDVRV